MMRWWNHDEYTKPKQESEKEGSSLKSDDHRNGGEGGDDLDVRERRNWKFRVRAVTAPGETVCVTGNCHTLGNWNNDEVFILAKENEEEEGNEHLWSGIVKLPMNQVEYRYVICILVEPDGQKILQRKFIVRRWETNLLPRIISKDATLNISSSDTEVQVFGFYDNKEKIERGWLTTETAVQLKLFNNHLQVWKSQLQGRKVYVKVTPINLTRANSVSHDVSGEDCLSLETMDLTDKADCWPVVEIAVMSQGERDLKFQDQFGKAYSEEDFIVFQILVHVLESVAFLVDFYSYSSRASEEEPPYHVGFSYILPSALKHSEGQAVVPITSTKHRPIGQLTVEYLVIKPISNFRCDLRCSHQRLWKDSWYGLDVGHRGVGTSFKMGDIRQCAEVRENTIASLKTAASHGADFVEFDVQLSKDLVPVLYHDFYVAIAMRRKKQLNPEEMIQLPLKDLSLEQLHLLKLYHVTERGTNKYSDEHLEDHQPFPTLKQALEVLDPSVGFDIEIKWTMQLKDGTYELYHPFDLNLYLDTVLEVVLNHGGTRNIVFSCFHPDICSMIRLKQNRYPVMFLTQGITDKYPAYHDPRCQNIPMAVHFAVSMDILGINVHTEELLRDSSQVSLVKRAGLVLFCWGDDNNDTATIKHLKNLGIHAVIYDKIDQISNKEVKESIFSMEAKESERVVIRAAAEKAHSTDEYLRQGEEPSEVVQSNYILEKARQKIEGGMGSLSSSLSLWSSDNQPSPLPETPS